MMSFRIAMCQINPRTGAITENLESVKEFISKAKEAKADLVIFPEMALTGYCIADMIEDIDFLKQNRLALDALTNHANGIAVIVGFVDFNEDLIRPDGFPEKYNSAAVIQDGEIKWIYNKILLPDDRFFDDKRYFTPGKNAVPVELEVNGKRLRLGLEICEDLWEDAYEIKPTKLLAIQLVDLVVNISASPYFAGKPILREEQIRKRAIEYKVPYLLLNTSGIGDNSKNIIPFDGNSRFFDKRGELIGAMGHFEAGMEIVEIDLTSRTGTPITQFHPQELEEVFIALVESLRLYARNGGFKTAVLGLSGGIDSALTAVIATEAFGKENVTALNMPSRFNSQTTREAAEELACNLGINYKVVPIQKLYEGYLELFKEDFSGLAADTTEENLQARIRGNILMAFSNKFGHLLLATGNKTEIALGYCTLYGDMSGGVEVIGDIGKMDTYRLAQYINDVRYKKEIIPQISISIPASAELKEGQVDPFDYDVVDPVVRDLIEYRRSYTGLMEDFRRKQLNPGLYRMDRQGKTVYDKHDEASFSQLVKDIQRRIQGSVYKRTQAPPIIVVSRRAFGYDLRESIQNQWYNEQK